ncbi:tetrathionate reductase family octaheme c-type cytochrome, partial [Myxococcota bacterium]|nr:tetrathionate reductase family octaheme c-type cytochrome [Myxococcota bacterium]
MSGAAPVCVDNCAEGTECVEGACVAVTPAACEPACDACQTCDMSGDAPVCVDNCAEGTECVEGACVAVTPATCEPVCDACQTCDMSGDAPVCVDNCAEGTECVEGACVAVTHATCEPACDACQTCDTTGDAPVCVDNCAEGTECVEGVCQAPVVPTCEACGPCQLCDTTGEAPICVSICGEAEVCVEGACRRASVHANLDALNGPFDNASAVTTACLNCHQDDATRFMATSHWRWTGPTPGLAGHEADNTIGKRNLINNFCIATVSNEARCTQCHAGYDWRDDNYDLNDATKVDCLVCHAQPSLYSKATTTAGNPPDTVDLEMAARSVGPTTVANCGKCHFGAGGGDNVKKGDLGSALLQATPESDVHMGRGMACAGCHAGDQHNVLGASVHGAVDNGRLSCADCHGVEPHVNAALNNHALDIACQTCHIPAFSRQQPTKMDWDWSTAGDRTRGENGVVTGTTAGGATVTVYDAMKGDFVWIENVRPEYAWHDGTIARMTTQDQHPEGAGTEEMPVILGRPLATHDAPDALIWPFKVMRGRQPIDPTRRLVIVPKLFGPGGFWGAIPAAADYTPEAVAALWATALTNGARLAGQIGAEEAYAVGDWVWGYTEMYMGINHEVAPAAAALGCMDCHNNPAFDFEALGYSCDPMTGGAGCGSRH